MPSKIVSWLLHIITRCHSLSGSDDITQFLCSQRGGLKVGLASTAAWTPHFPDRRASFHLRGKILPAFPRAQTLAIHPQVLKRTQDGIAVRTIRHYVNRWKIGSSRRTRIHRKRQYKDLQITDGTLKISKYPVVHVK